MVDKLRVAVIMGGDSAERDVSLQSGAAVLAGLDAARYEATPVVLENFSGADSLPAALRQGRFDVAFIALHGGAGEDGRLQAALEEIGLLYIGSGPRASARAMDKIVSREVFSQNGLLVPPGAAFRGLDKGGLAEACRQALASPGLPLVVKPACEGSTFGITIVREQKDLAGAFEAALAFGPDILAEQYIAGREITAAVVGNDSLRVLPLIEIVPQSGFYDYHAKYVADDTAKLCPAPLPDGLAEGVRRAAKKAYAALGCRGFGRVDFIVTDNDIYLLEVNTIPGLLGDHSLVPCAAKAAGLPFSALLDEIIQLAREERARVS